MVSSRKCHRDPIRHTISAFQALQKPNTSLDPQEGFLMPRLSLNALRPRHYLILFGSLIGLILVVVLPTVLTHHRSTDVQETSSSPATTSSNGSPLNVTQGRIAPGSLVNCTDIQCDLRVMTERRLSTIIGNTENASFLSSWLVDAKHPRLRSTLIYSIQAVNTWT